MCRALFFLLPVLLAAVFIQGCSKEERDPCLQPQTTVLVARAMRHADTGTALVDTALPNPVLHPLTDQTTQYLFGGTKKVIRFTFSLSNTADSSRWILRPDSAGALQDTLSFYYQRQLHFLSNACGYTYYYYVDSAKTTRNAIDSLRLLRSDVTTDANITNLTIIYR